MAIRSLNIILALAVFLSSSGFVVNKHYCRGVVRNVAIFVHAKDCRHKTQSSSPATAPKSCHSQDKEPKNCCSEESEYCKLDQDQQVSSPQLKSLNVQALIHVMPIVLRIDAPEIDAHSLHYLTYRPPPVCDDFQSMLQTFRL